MIFELLAASASHKQKVAKLQKIALVIITCKTIWKIIRLTCKAFKSLGLRALQANYRIE